MIEVFDGPVENDFGHVSFVSGGPDEYDEGWTGTRSCAVVKNGEMGGPVRT